MAARCKLRRCKLRRCLELEQPTPVWVAVGAVAVEVAGVEVRVSVLKVLAGVTAVEDEGEDTEEGLSLVESSPKMSVWASVEVRLWLAITGSSGGT